MARRRLSNPLALAVLAALLERSMHPYEMATLIRSRGKDQSIKINWGSLYTVVQTLEKHRYIEATGTTRQGRRPERTIYSITDAGREELEDWLRELVSVPVNEYPRFEAALSELPALPPDEAVELLEHRIRAQEMALTAGKAMLAQAGQDVPRLFLIESEYQMAMRQAEIDWIRGLVKEITDGTLTGLEAWRTYHTSQ
jgi:DNA-binding PadR family transcriptional regulator